MERIEQLRKYAEICRNERVKAVGDFFTLDDVEYLLSLIDRYKEALMKLDEVIKFDREEETWVDESMLGINTGVALTIRENHISMLNRLNEAKKFARSVLDE